jgi:hypothetical protein
LDKCVTTTTTTTTTATMGINVATKRTPANLLHNSKQNTHDRVAAWLRTQHAHVHVPACLTTAMSASPGIEAVESHTKSLGWTWDPSSRPHFHAPDTDDNNTGSDNDVSRASHDTQTTTRSSTRAKAYKANRSLARAKRHRPGDTSSDDEPPSGGVELDAATAAVLRLVSQLNQEKRQALLRELGHFVSQFSPPPAEPAAEPSPRDKPVPTPTPVPALAPTSMEVDADPKPAPPTTEPVPAPPTTEPKPNAMEVDTDPEPEPTSPVPSDTESCATPPAPPPGVAACTWEDGVCVPCAPTKGLPTTVPAPPKHAPVVPHKARPTQPTIALQQSTAAPPPSVAMPPPAASLNFAGLPRRAGHDFFDRPMPPHGAPHGAPLGAPHGVPHKAPPLGAPHGVPHKAPPPPPTTHAVFQLPPMPPLLPLATLQHQQQPLAFPNPWAAGGAGSHPPPTLAAVGLHPPPTLAAVGSLESILAQHQGTMCPLCPKMLTPEHMCSHAHAQRVSEHKQLDALLGRPASGVRVLRTVEARPVYVKHRDELTKELVARHWGVDMSTFASRAKSRLAQTNGYKMGKTHHPFDSRWECEIMMVSYKGQGRYAAGDVAIPWTMLPSGRPGSSNDPPPLSVQFAQEEALENVGWWPTVHVYIPGTENGPCQRMWVRTATGWLCVVICVYQLL